MDVEGSLHVVDLKDLQDDEVHVDIQQFFLSKFKSCGWSVCVVAVLPEVKKVAVVFVRLVITVGKVVADQL